MPAVLPPGNVLVTGVSGFSGIWIAHALLANDFHVRGTVRNPEKGAYVADVFKNHVDRFEIVIVPDISKARPPLSFPRSSLFTDTLCRSRAAPRL